MKRIAYDKGNSLRVKRILSTLIDWYIAATLAGIPVLLIYSNKTGNSNIAPTLASIPSYWGIIAGILAISICLAYYILVPLKWKRGQTLGKKLLGIKIVNSNSGDVNILNMIKRELLGVTIIEGGIICASEYLREIAAITVGIEIYKILIILSLVVTGASIISLFKNKEGKMFHDILGNTKVVMV